MNKAKFEQTAELHQCVDAAMLRLIAIWDEIGIVGDQRIARKGVVLLHLRNLLDEMANEEELLKSRLVENVEKFTADLSRLCKELGIPPYKSNDSLTMLQLEKDIRAKVDGLTKEKNDRLKHLKQLTKMDEQLCARLAMTPHYVPSGMVPSTQQLAELEEHIRGLETEQMRRQKNFTGMQEKIVQMLEDLELSPNTSFERNVVCDLETVPLTTDNLKAAKSYHDELEVLLSENRNVVFELWDKVKSLWERLSLPKEHRIKFEDQHSGYSHRTILALKEELVRCERLKLQNIQQIVEATRKELVSWWDRCFVLPDIRASFKPFYEEKMSEELLLVHEAEIESMRQYYRQNQEMLEKVAKRQQLWEELLDLEHKANNPDRFLNRGCNLLKEEKARKKLAVELPKIEHEVSLQIRNWETVTGKPFLLCGMPFEEYIRKQRDDFIAEKENERLQRQQQKARQMEEEIMYGSKPVTPGTKRFAGNTPTKTPNKCRKVETTPCKVGLSTHKSRTNMANLISPVCLPPRHKDKPTLSKAVSSPSIDRLTEHNRASSCQTLNANMAITGMTVVAPSIGITNSDPDLSSMSLLSVGLYDDFANGLNRTSKPNIRSTLAPKGAYF